MIIALDGPAASGKGTLGRKIAAHYELAYLDTGLLYRAAAWRVLSRNEDPQDEEAAERAARSLDLNQIDADVLRNPDVGRAASIVAAMEQVRAAVIA